MKTATYFRSLFFGCLFLFANIPLIAQDMSVWMGKGVTFFVKNKKNPAGVTSPLSYCKLLDYDGSFKYFWLKDTKGKLIAYGPMWFLGGDLNAKAQPPAATDFFKIKFTEPGEFEVSKEAYALITSVNYEEYSVDGKKTSSIYSFKIQIGKSDGTVENFSPFLEINSQPHQTTWLRIGEVPFAK